MKSLARGYVWWLNLVLILNSLCNNAILANNLVPQPPISPIHSWEVPKQSWNHLHLDFAGPYLGNMFLVLVDDYSKWLDVIVMKSITTTAMVDQL